MKARLKSAGLWAAIGALCGAALVVVLVFSATNSTAAIGLLFVPIFGIAAAIPFAVFGFCLPDLVGLVKGTSEPAPNRNLAALAGGLILASGVILFHAFQLTQDINSVRAMSAIQLAEFLDRDELGRNRLALAALTENPNATPEMLDRVARLPVPKMEDPVGSWLPVMGKNKKGLSVARLIAMDERAKPETLDFLAQSRAEDVRGAVASNPKTPGPALLSIAQKGGSYADWGLAANPNTPSDILRRIADAGDEYARSSVARNKGAPPDLLVKLAADPVWHVRRDAASNKNLPLDAAQHLAQDPDERVSGVAAWRLKR